MHESIICLDPLVRANPNVETCMNLYEYTMCRTCSIQLFVCTLLSSDKISQAKLKLRSFFNGSMGIDVAFTIQIELSLADTVMFVVLRIGVIQEIFWGDDS